LLKRSRSPHSFALALVENARRIESRIVILNSADVRRPDKFARPEVDAKFIFASRGEDDLIEQPARLRPRLS